MAQRKERVVLELTDHLTPGLAKAAGAALALDKALDGVGGDIGRTGRVAATAAPQIDRFGASAARAGSSLDSFSGRTGIALDLLLAFGPAAVGAAAVSLPALAAIATGAGALGVAAGSAAIAFGGVGEAMEAMNTYRLEPTKENLRALEQHFDKIGPAAEGFVRQLDSMRGLGAEIRSAGAQSLFPGLTDALVALEERGPDAVRIVERFNRVTGDLSRDAARSLAGPEWDDFFRMINRQGPRALDTMGRALGDVAHGASEVLEAFAPTSQRGLRWVGDVADDFDRWATGLRGSDDFREFIGYVRETGPQVADTLGAVATAAGDIAGAMAPLAGPSLTGIRGISEAVSAIAASGFGTELLVGLGALRAMRRVGGMAGAGGVGGIAAAARAGGPGAALSVATGVVPVFVTNPGFGGAGGVPGAGGGRGRGGVGMAPLAFGGPFGLAAAGAGGLWALGNSDWARAGGFGNPLRDFKPTASVESLGDLPIGDATFDIHARIDEDEAAKVRAKIEAITAKPYTASVELEDQRARRVAQGVHRMLDDVASQRPTPKIDADPAPATGKSNGVKRLLDEVGNKRPRPRIDAQDGASPVINRVSGLLAGLDGRTANTTITTTYVTRRVNEGNAGGFTNLGPQSMTGSADGSTVPKGGAYRDKFPYLLAPGEEVISNRYGQADRHRALLKAINANRLADGGTARAIAAGLRGGTAAGGGARGGGGGGDVVAVLAPGTRLVMETDLGPLMARVADRQMNAQARWDRDQTR